MMTPEEKSQLVEGQKDAVELVREEIRFWGKAYRSRVQEYQGRPNFTFMQEIALERVRKWQAAERVLRETIDACNSDGPWFNFEGKRVG